MSHEGKIVHHSHHHHGFPDQSPPPPPSVLPQYGTFEGIPPPQAQETGIGVIVHHHHQPGHHHRDDSDWFRPPVFPRPEYYYSRYQTVPGHAVAEGTPVRDSRLPCCGSNFCCFLFVVGFFLVFIWVSAHLF